MVNQRVWMRPYAVFASSTWWPNRATPQTCHLPVLCVHLNPQCMVLTLLCIKCKSHLAKTFRLLAWHDMSHITSRCHTTLRDKSLCGPPADCGQSAACWQTVAGLKPSGGGANIFSSLPGCYHGGWRYKAHMQSKQWIEISTLQSKL